MAIFPRPRVISLETESTAVTGRTSSPSALDIQFLRANPTTHRVVRHRHNAYCRTPSFPKAHVETHRGDLRVPFPRDFVARLRDRRVRSLRRRAKYLLLDLDSDETLIVHLGMSGRFTVHHSGIAVRPGAFTHKMPDDGSGSGVHDHAAQRQCAAFGSRR